MKANELRIDNLFQDETTKTIIKVIGLTNEIITFTGHFKNDWQAEPIPLTEEWLLKLGFEKDFLEWDKQCISLQYWKQSNSYHWVSSSGDIDVLLKHVHQLQNLYFALTNKELTI